MKCEKCGQEVQSSLTHVCNPTAIDMFQNPWKYSSTSNGTGGKE